jgi:hypothetical protein
MYSIAGGLTPFFIGMVLLPVLLTILQDAGLDGCGRIAYILQTWESASQPWEAVCEGSLLR